MVYYKNKQGEVFAYESKEDRDEYGDADLIKMTPEQVGAHLNPPVATEPAPQQITMRQARLMLHRAGLLTGVQAEIDALEEPKKTEAQIEWDYAQTVNRDNPIMQLLADSLGLSDESLDEMFIEASKL